MTLSRNARLEISAIGDSTTITTIPAYFCGARGQIDHFPLSRRPRSRQRERQSYSPKDLFHFFQEPSHRTDSSSVLIERLDERLGIDWHLHVIITDPLGAGKGLASNLASGLL